MSGVGILKHIAKPDLCRGTVVLCAQAFRFAPILLSCARNDALQSLRVDLTNWRFNTFYSEYDHFEVGSMLGGTRPSCCL